MFAPATALPCDALQKRRLEHLVRAGKTPQKVVLRAKIILLAVKGLSNNRIAKDMQTTRPTVLLWRTRFLSSLAVRDFSKIFNGPVANRSCRIERYKT